MSSKSNFQSNFAVVLFWINEVMLNAGNIPILFFCVLIFCLNSGLPEQNLARRHEILSSEFLAFNIVAHGAKMLPRSYK